MFLLKNQIVFNGFSKTLIVYRGLEALLVITTICKITKELLKSAIYS